MEYRCIRLDIWRALTSPIPQSWEVTQLCSSFFGQGDESSLPLSTPKTGSFCKISPYTGVGSLYSIDFWFSGVLYLGQQIGSCGGNHMENLSAYRYCIAMKKGRKIFIIIAGCTMILISSIFIILTVIFYVLEQEFGFYTFLGTLLIPLIFFIFGILGIVAATKRVEIYKGKVVYHIGFTNKEYRMSDIRTSKTQTETYNTGLYLEDIVPVYNYDKVTVFYDEKGKKLFEFGLDYDNVERLKANGKEENWQRMGVRICLLFYLECHINSRLSANRTRKIKNQEGAWLK